MQPRWSTARLVLGLGLGVALAVAPTGCHSESSDGADAQAPSTWPEDFWIDKAARTLRAGRGVGRDDSLDELRAMPRDAVVRRFMAAPEFADTVLDFTLYFLGFKMNALRDEHGELSHSLAYYPAALAATQAAIGGGDWFRTLVRMRQPRYVEPLDAPGAAVDGATNSEIRALLRKQEMAKVDAAIASLQAKPPASSKAVCASLYGKDFDDILVALYNGFPFTGQLAIAAAFSPSMSGLGCNPNASPSDMLAHVTKLRDNLNALLDFLETLAPENGYAPKMVAEFRTIDPAKFGLGAEYDDQQFTTDGVYYAAINSSTNYNRKRASYVLARYFCDDLTPVGVAIDPKAHVAGDRHASDPACQACHYKLDPMAGFFKDYGAYGMYMPPPGAGVSATLSANRGLGIAGAQRPRTIDFFFDDRVTLDAGAQTKYRDAWRDASGAREWNVGYVRSSTDASRNTYGLELEDLFRIIAEAPEVKSCVVRRLFAYLVGEGQVVDPAFLGELADTFSAAEDATPATAFQDIMARIVLSRTFSEPYVVASECYDFGGDGAPPKDAPPCAVSSILQTSCVGCHTAGHVSGLDLGHWVAMADGFGFPHVVNGAQVPRGETFARIRDRLTTTDPARRMPPGAYMSDLDRAALVRWTDSLQGPQGQ
jgi:hypothetical protein